jgi:hypothetical protein
MNEQESERDDQGLSEFHRDYIRRWMEYELRSQQVSSDRYLSERKLRRDASDLKQIKVPQNRS